MSQQNGKSVEVCCPQCLGVGRVPLTGVYYETLVLLRQQNVPRSGAELGRLAGCKGEAMANRLVRLEALGLAVGESYGRRRLWRATAP